MPNQTARTLAGVSLVLCALAGHPASALAGGEACRLLAADSAKKPAQPTVQLAILLDTSNSMDGLINQARTQLWTIVNQFATAKREGQRPRLEVALYEYGKASLAAGEGHLRQILPLTTDLDTVSQQLFALTTNGGDEFCGWAIDAAAKGLSWSENPNDLKIILVAGNEPFTQGTVDYHASIPVAVKKGIVVNTIFCGEHAEGEKTGWKDGAVLGEGSFSSINTDAQQVHVDAPQDQEIVKLSADLNTTYLGFGAEREEAAANQVAQDSNAVTAAPAVGVQRAITKSSGLYSNSSWDLVDAVKEEKVKIEDVKKDDLPEELRTLSSEELKAKVSEMQTKREQLQKRIAELNDARVKYVAEQLKLKGEEQGKTLEAAVLAAIKSQAQRRGYEFDKK
jgi:hypothetical protein